MLNLNKLFPLEEIIGIGPVMANDLAELGFVNNIDMLGLPEDVLVNHLSQVDGLSTSMIINSILPQARLLRLPGTTGQLADAFVDSGYFRYTDFLGVKSNKIEKIISKLNVNTDKTENLLLSCEMLITAVQLAVTGSVRIVVVDVESNEKISSAKISYNGDQRQSEITLTQLETTESGIVDFEGIPAIPTSFRVSAEGYSLQTIIAEPRIQSHVTYKALMIKSSELSLTNYDEFLGGLAVGFTTLPMIHKSTELINLPSRPPIFIENIKENSVVAGSLWFRQEWDRIIIPRLKIDSKELPNEIKQGDVLIPESDSWKLHPEGITASKFRELFMKQRSQEIQQGGEL